MIFMLQQHKNLIKYSKKLEALNLKAKTFLKG